MLRRITTAIVLSVISCTTTFLAAENKEALFQRLLQASHSSRINDVDMNPWHMKGTFQLYESNGKAGEAGTFEEWGLGPVAWKLKIESPSYTATTIENQNKDFRTIGVGPIPVRIKQIVDEFVYPIPMAEDLDKGCNVTLHRKKIENTSVDCIERVSAGMYSNYATECLDQHNILRAVEARNTKKSWLHSNPKEFQGHFIPLSLVIKDGKENAATAEISNLEEIKLSDDLFTPSPDMVQVTGMHTLRVVSK